MAKIEPDKIYKGKKTLKVLQQGPLARRGCTDIICLIIFALIWAGMILIATYGFNKGDPMAISAPYDQFGNPCGLGHQVNYPYLYFIERVDILRAVETVCVKECPVDKKSTLSCSLDYTAAGKECSELDVYATTPFAERVCIPQDPDYLAQLEKQEALSLNFLFKGAADLRAAWWMVPIVGVIGIFIGLIYIVLMRFCSGVVTWGLLVLYEIALFGFGGLCIIESLHSSFFSGLSIKSLASINPLTLQIIGGGVILIALISLTLMCIFRRKLKLAVAVLQEASEFVAENVSILFVPPVFFLISVGFYTFWIFAEVYLLGSSDIIPGKDQLPFNQVSMNKASTYFSLIQVFALFWNHLFFTALPQFVITSSATLWYWRKVKPRKSPVALSVCRTIQHIGSIALGSIMLGLFDYIRVLFRVFERPLMKSKKDKHHWCAKYCTFCFRGCLTCFEGCLKYIERHAYVQIAMTGNGFCQSTRDAFYLIMRNSIKFGSVHGMGTFFVFFGQIFIAAVSTISGYIILVMTPYFQDRLFSPIVPTIFFGLISLMIGQTFMSIYGVAADAIIHCYAMDDEVHEEGAMYAPLRLKRLVDRSSRGRAPLLANDADAEIEVEVEAEPQESQESRVN